MDYTNSILGTNPVTGTNPILSALDPQTLMYVIIGAAAGILLNAVIWGLVSMRLARRKGYHGYFWTGFFFWFVGLIYVVGLPLSDEKRISDMKKLVQISVRAGLR
jgi:hypothetical protein